MYFPRRVGNEETEFDFWLMEFNPEVATVIGKEQVAEILFLLRRFGQQGVIDYVLRHEGAASALAKTDTNRGLPGMRLYCIKMSSNVLILLGGGMKTKNKPEDCPNVSRHFRFAKQLASCIDHNTLIAQDNTLFSPDGSVIITHP